MDLYGFLWFCRLFWCFLYFIGLNCTSFKHNTVLQSMGQVCLGFVIFLEGNRRQLLGFKGKGLKMIWRLL